jgi:hypothetical protein
MKNYRKFFENQLHSFYPEKDITELMTVIDLTYREISKDIAFVPRSRNPMDRRLDVCAYFLATVMVLEKQGEPFETIRQIMLAIANDFVRPKNKVQAWLKQLPPKLISWSIFKLLIKQLGKRTLIKADEGGFVAQIITDKEQTYGFGYGVDILECGICKLFAKHQYQAYSPILCEVDYITSKLAGLEIIRTGTIANGASKCDFRYKKINHPI